MKSKKQEIQRLPDRLALNAASFVYRRPRMKKIADQLSLKNQIESISMSELRQHPGEVFAQVGLGKVFVIKKNGREVAVLSAVPGTELTTIIAPDGSKTYRISS